MKRPAVFLAIPLLLVIGAIAVWFASVRPWQSKILAQGHSPEGREYCVVQTFKDLVEPYQVSFYVRDSDGIWRWNYLEHEDKGWKSARVTFSDGSALIERNGVRFKEIEIPTDQVDMAKVRHGYRDYYCDSGFSVQDVFTFHNQKYH